MRVRARRGVCIGVDRHLLPGDTVDLEAAQVTFLVSIGAVEQLPDEPVVVDAAPSTAPATDDEASQPRQSTSLPGKKLGKKEK